MQIENFGELFGMQPAGKTEDGAILMGYGAEDPPEAMPWETGQVKGKIGETRPDGPVEALWLEAYEGLLSWISEVLRGSAGSDRGNWRNPDAQD